MKTSLVAILVLVTLLLVSASVASDIYRQAQADLVYRLHLTLQSSILSGETIPYVNVKR